MRCDNCGEKFRGKATIDTCSVGPSGRYTSNTTVRLILCPTCVKRRQGLGRFLVLSFLFLVFAIIALSILLRATGQN